MVKGLEELHELGFVHRDLKPENIVLNLTRPIKVAIIDFDRTLPRTNTSRTGTRGTPGYEPKNFIFADGDINWDLYSLIAITSHLRIKIPAIFSLIIARIRSAVLRLLSGDQRSCLELFQDACLCGAK